MRKILLPFAMAALAVSGCTVVEPAPQVVTGAPAASATAEANNEPYCREYTTTSTIDGTPQTTTGTACRDANGQWRIVDTQNPPGAGATGSATTAPPPSVVYAYPPYPYYYPYPYPYYYPGFFSLGFGFGGHFHHHHH